MEQRAGTSQHSRGRRCSVVANTADTHGTSAVGTCLGHRCCDSTSRELLWVAVHNGPGISSKSTSRFFVYDAWSRRLAPAWCGDASTAPTALSKNLLMPNKLCWFVALAWMCAQQCGASSHGDSDAEADSREEVFELSDYAIALHRAEFLNIDSNQNSMLDFYELHDHFTSYDDGQDITNDDIEGFIEDLDANFDGRVSWLEYRVSLAQQKFETPITSFTDP